jgi:hypothetical protein
MSGATGPVPYSIIAPTSPFVDVRTGRITREWYRFLLSLFATGGSGQPQPSPAQIETMVSELETLTAALPTPPGGPDYRSQITDLNTMVALLFARSSSSGSSAATLSGKSFSYTLAWGAGSVAQNGTIEIEGNAPADMHVLGVDYSNGVNAGTIDGAFQIGTTPITGLNPVVNNGTSSATATGANALAAGDTLRVVLTAANGVISDGGYFTPFGTYD